MKAGMLVCPDGTLYLWYSKTTARSLSMKRDHCTKCGYIRKLRKYSRIDPLVRFMNHADRDAASGCLLWTGGTNDQGYPHFNFIEASGKRRGMGAHRWIFREKFGYLPPVVMHKCDTPICVDWERCLIPGTHADNMADMIRKGRDDHSKALFRFEPDQVREIRHRRDLGDTAKELAAIYGVSVNSISGLVNRRTYRDVE